MKYHYLFTCIGASLAIRSALATQDTDAAAARLTRTQELITSVNTYQKALAEAQKIQEENADAGSDWTTVNKISGIVEQLTRKRDEQWKQLITYIDNNAYVGTILSRLMNHAAIATSNSGVTPDGSLSSIALSSTDIQALNTYDIIQVKKLLEPFLPFTKYPDYTYEPPSMFEKPNEMESSGCLLS